MIELLKRAVDEEVTPERVAEALRPLADGAGADELNRVATTVTDFVRAIPDGLAWVFELARDARCGRAVAFATGTVLHYLLDADDLLPEAELGPLGLLDDAFLVHAFVAKLAQIHPFAGASLPEGLADPHAMRVVATMLPEGVAHALLRTCESTTLVAESLLGSGTSTGTPVAPAEHGLRVAEALAALDPPDLVDTAATDRAG